MTTSVSLADIRAELQRLGVDVIPDADGKTAEEWSELWRCSPTRTRATLRKCWSNDMLIVTQQLRSRIDGRTYWATLYAFKHAPKAKRGGRQRKKTT